ncbi:hypothetical protein [Phenylobacterium sp.]|uniref:hypothetical protein n=1 Tax=Phenylobacterium sp. TaxID=1871053 RepID=UPI00286CFE16|nr:hypothetical protein [Phenylobacterium sp.]
MAPLFLAFALFLLGQPAEAPAESPAAEPPAPAPAAEDRWPSGAPHDDYAFVAWCYGTLRGYLDLHDQVMPEVTRIEATYRPPGRKLSDDLKVYADMEKAGRAQLKVYQAALTAAEKASLKPINTIGAAALNKGRATWNAGPEVTKARLAQAWMSWTLPARCDTAARDLEARATLFGASFKVNDEPEAAPAAAEATPAPETAPPPQQPPAPTPN